MVIRLPRSCALRWRPLQFTPRRPSRRYCRPVIPVNFNGPLGGNTTNGQYPSGYLAIDGKGNVYGEYPKGIQQHKRFDFRNVCRRNPIFHVNGDR